MWMRAEQLRYCERAVFAQSVSACNGCRGFAAIVARGPPLPVLARCACCGPLTTDLPAVLPLFSRRLCLADGPPASGAVRAREVGTPRRVSPRIATRIGAPHAARSSTSLCSLHANPPPPSPSPFGFYAVWSANQCRHPTVCRRGDLGLLLPFVLCAAPPLPGEDLPRDAPTGRENGLRTVRRVRPGAACAHHR